MDTGKQKSRTPLLIFPGDVCLQFDRNKASGSGTGNGYPLTTPRRWQSGGPRTHNLGLGIFTDR